MPSMWHPTWQAMETSRWHSGPQHWWHGWHVMERKKTAGWSGTVGKHRLVVGDGMGQHIYIIYMSV